MQYATFLALAVVGHSAALPALKARQDSLHTGISMGDSSQNYGTVIPADALTEALNSQCVSTSNQCNPEEYTYSSSTSVALSYTPGGSSAVRSETESLVFSITGDWASETQRQALISGMAAALSTATANNSFYDSGSAGNAYLAATPGFEFEQYNAPTFIGISIIDDTTVSTSAMMNFQVTEQSADAGWCGAESGLFGAISAAVGAVPVVGSSAGAVFGALSAACAS